MKITDVEAMVLDTGKDYPDPNEAAEAHGVRFVSLIKISTDEGIVGWSDIETQPHVGHAIVNAPSGGAVGFESIRAALIGEDPLERERLWQKMTRYLAYCGMEHGAVNNTPLTSRIIKGTSKLKPRLILFPRLDAHLLMPY